MTIANHESCIEACIACAQACEECFAACLREPHVEEMAECIRLDRDCAAICWLTASLLQHDSEFAHDQCAVCVEVCRACGMECSKHHAIHCRRCADMCDRCAQECARMMTASV